MKHLKPWFVAFLLAAGPLGAQESGKAVEPYRSRLLDQTGPERQDDAEGRGHWWRLRMGGELPQEFLLRLAREGQREHARLNERAPAVFGSAASTLPAWVNIGPTTATRTQNGPKVLAKVDSGRVRWILPHPTDADIVYAVVGHGGLWKATGFTTSTPTWTPLSDNLGSTSVGAGALGKTPQILYLGMGDPFGSAAGYGGTMGAGGFMHLSTDGGTTWSGPYALNNGSTSATVVWDVKVDSSGVQDVILVGTNAGMFRSTNGTSYTAVGTLPFSGKIVKSLVRTSQGWLAAATSGTPSTGTLYTSPDGISWNPIPNTGAVLSNVSRITLGVGLPGDAIVYGFAATSGNSGQRDLFKSTDGGLNWTALGITAKAPTNPNSEQADMDLMHGQSSYNQMLLVDPTDPNRNTVYLGGNLSTAKSMDGGASWTVTSNWLAQSSLPYVHADCHGAAFSNIGGVKRLFFGTDGGIFTSIDNGTTWDDTKNTGLVAHYIHAMTGNATQGNSDSVLIGLQDNGTRLRVGNTSTFNQPKGGDGFGVGWSQANRAVALGSYVYSNIYRSTSFAPDTGSAWSDALVGIKEVDDSTNSYFATPIATPGAVADPTGLVFFHNTKSKLYRTTNGGLSWTPILDMATTAGIDPARIVRAVMHGIGISPLDTNHIALAGSTGYLPITTDGGATWREVNLATVSGYAGFNAGVAWASNSLIYVCSENTATGAVLVVRSTDGGTSWAPANAGLPDVPVTKLVVDPKDGTGNTVYAATWLGVYQTTNGGAAWSRFGTGLPLMPVSDLYITPTGSLLRAATFGRGVWEITGAVIPGPTISTQPANKTVNVGETATFTVAATGTGTLNYQWKRGTPNVGTNSSSFTTPTTVLADNGSSFSVSVTDNVGTTVSSSALLTVNPKNRDLSGDGSTNVLDLATLMAAYSGSGVTTSSPAADLDGDGDCDDDDLALLLAGI